MTERKIFLSACEASAEKHCAALMHSLRQQAAEKGESLIFSGIGGKRMESQGCELIAETVSKAAMIYNAFGQVGFYWQLIRKLRRYFEKTKPDLVIVCDSPAFNFHVAKAAKKSGAKVLFYVAPQLWAWAPWRLGKLKRCCDKLACILPFEKQWFTTRSVDAEFIGNPLFDELQVDLAASKKDYTQYNPQSAKLVLLPGSRDAELNTLWQPMQKIALKLRQKLPELSLTAVAPDQDKLEKLKSLQLEGFDCDYKVDSVLDACRDADYSLVASGSATLQVAAAGCPMTIMYQSNKVLWHLVGKFLINIKKLSLVNILAGDELVPEFMPYFTSIEPIYDKTLQMLEDKSSLRKTSDKLIELVKPLASQKACENCAKIALEL